jgi:hypothetical protein
MSTPTIDLKTASYDGIGTVTATWGRVKVNGNAGFWARVDWDLGYQSYFVRDPDAVSVSLPMQFDHSVASYSLTLYGLSDPDSVNDDLYSAPLPVSGWPVP